jgi:phosphohistidine phosphatase
MLIYLLRHGIAIDRTDPESPPEAQRFLTEKGLERTRLATQGLATLGTKPDKVLTSPFVRARQTAEIALESLALDSSLLVETDALLWDAEPSLLASELASLTDVAQVLCAGHAPHLDRFIAHLIGSPLPFTELKKSAVAVLETDFEEPGDAHLLALYPPRTLRALAKAA